MIEQIINNASVGQLTEARDWASDRLRLVGTAVTNEVAVSYVIKRYPGGWNAFVAECCTEDASEYSTTIGGLRITVDKVGGGTLGRSYPGDWTVTVMNGPEYVYDGETLRTGLPKTHKQVARMAFEFASERIDGSE